MTLALQTRRPRAIVPCSGPRRVGRSRVPTGSGEGWSGAVVVAGDDMTAAVAFCRHVRLREVPLEPAAPGHPGRAGGRAPPARRPLRRLLRPAGPARGADGPAAASVLAQRAEHAARPHRVRPPHAQPRDLPGRRGRAGCSTSPTWSTSCCASWPATRPRSSPARRCSAGSGATSTTAAPARSTSTSGGCGPSWARSTPT